LDDLPALAAAAGEGPALLVIGSVAARCRHEARAQRHAGLAA
jgi:hypothetical protein